MLAAACGDHRIRLLDAATGKLRAVLEGHTDAITSLAFHHDLLASGSRDGTVRLWDTRDTACFGILSAP